MLIVPLEPLAIAPAVVLPRKVSIGSGAKRPRPKVVLVAPRAKKPPVLFFSFYVPLRGPQASPKAGAPSAVSYSATSGPHRVPYPYCPAFTGTGPFIKQLDWHPKVFG